MEATKQRPARSFLLKALLLAGSVLVAFLLIEAAVRLLGLADHLVTDPVFVAGDSPNVRYHYKPNLQARTMGNTELVTNSLGFRDIEYPAAPPEGAVRLVVLGDSFTLGHAVPFEDVFTEVMERDMSRRVSPARVEVINFGVSGFAIEDAVGVYLDIASSLRPRIAVLALISDDLNLNRLDNFVDAKGYLTKRAGGMNSLKAYLRASRLILLIKEAYLKRVYQRSRQYATKAVSAETIQPRLDLLDAHLGRFLEACRQGGVKPVFALLDTWYGPATNPVLEHLESNYPDLLVVNCTAALTEFPIEDIVEPRSGHPNAFGHELIAAEMKRALLPVVGRCLAQESNGTRP
jgi:hypothetical protein